MEDNEIKILAMNFYKGNGHGKNEIKSRILNWIFDADEAQIDRVLADMDIPETSKEVKREHLKQKEHLDTIEEKMASMRADRENYRDTHVYGGRTSGKNLTLLFSADYDEYKSHSNTSKLSYDVMRANYYHNHMDVRTPDISDDALNTYLTQQDHNSTLREQLLLKIDELEKQISLSQQDFNLSPRKKSSPDIVELEKQISSSKKDHNSTLREQLLFKIDELKKLLIQTDFIYFKSDLNLLLPFGAEVQFEHDRIVYARTSNISGDGTYTFLKYFKRHLVPLPMRSELDELCESENEDVYTDRVKKEYATT